MNNIDEAWGIYYRLVRQFPMWPSTFSTCPKCGEHPARGSDVCHICIEEELVALVGEDLARGAVDAASASSVYWRYLCEELDSSSSEPRHE